MKAWGYILAVALFVGAFLAGRWTKPRDVSYVKLRDTVIVRDTVTERIPEPQIVEVVRRDTCWLPIALPTEAGHTADAAAALPSDTSGQRNLSSLLARCATSLLRTVDSLCVPVVVPIERRVYVTDDYRAVVEGYRPSLVSMELYRQTQVVTVTDVPKPHRWGVGLQIGYGYMPTVNRAAPYIGIGIQYSLWRW